MGTIQQMHHQQFQKIPDTKVCNENGWSDLNSRHWSNKIILTLVLLTFITVKTNVRAKLIVVVMFLNERYHTLGPSRRKTHNFWLFFEHFASFLCDYQCLLSFSFHWLLRIYIWSSTSSNWKITQFEKFSFSNTNFKNYFFTTWTKVFFLSYWHTTVAHNCKFKRW